MTTVDRLGIPHPTGYPLYVLAGKLWTLVLPVGSIASRMRVFSAIAARAGGLPAARLSLRGEPCQETLSRSVLLAALALAAAARAEVGRGGGISRGYQYRDAALVAGPVKGIRVRRGRFKVVGRGAQLGHTLAINPTPVTVVLQIGDRGQRYCAQYGGTTEYKPDVVYRGRRAPAPSACPK